MAATQGVDQEDLYKQLDAYDWDNDREFQSGLRAILGSSSSPEQLEHLTTRAKCFFYSRKCGTRVDFQGYEDWRQNHSESSSVGNEPQLSSEAPRGDVGNTSHTESEVYGSATTGDAPTPATFAEICEMIAQGKPIPGIKEIPDTILEGQGTHATATRRKKPWEKDASASATLSWQT
ncbi:hypothetical protein MBLNU457_7046t1 [Dothideomycetes sp. NU457]